MTSDPAPSSPEGLALELVALVVLVLLAGFFAASESALVSISRLRARAIVERRVRGSGNLERVVDDKTRFLTAILVGNTVVLLVADSLATYIAISLGIPAGAVLSTVVMAAVFLLFGEIIPKTVATGDSERWAIKLALPMQYAAYVLTPIARTFEVTTDLILRLFGIKHAHRPYVTEEDIRALVNVGAEQRVIEEQERELIHSVMEFGDTIVREVMKPRPEMVAVSVEESPRRALDLVIAEGYSKLPVYQESKDDIVGVIHDRELLIALANGSLAHTSVRALMRAVVHVPETKKIADLLREMQRDKFSLAIVVDEYGGTAGLVTMEDLLEEIVGEIRDEHDVDEQESIAMISQTRSGGRSRDQYRGRQCDGSARSCRRKILRRSADTRSDYSGAFRTKARRSTPPATRAYGSIARAVAVYSPFASTPTASSTREKNRRRLTQPRAYKTRGVILRGRQLGEADRIVTFFTLERGKLDAVAKGVRRPRSHFAGRLEQFNECDLLVHRGRSLDVIVSAEIRSARWSALVEPQRYAVAALLAELVDAFCEPDLAMPDVYELLVGAIAAVAVVERAAHIAAAFLAALTRNARARASAGELRALRRTAGENGGSTRRASGRTHRRALPRTLARSSAARRAGRCEPASAGAREG